MGAKIIYWHAGGKKGHILQKKVKYIGLFILAKMKGERRKDISP